MPGRVTWLLILEALAVGLLRLPADVRFDWFAFFDGGASLTIHSLTRRGLSPTIDFGYIYGLLPLALGDAWFRTVGLTPGAFATLSILGGMGTAWGIGRVLEGLRVGWIGTTWVAVAMPIGLITASAPSLTHVLEPIFLTHGLAELAAGKKSRALVLGVICLFVKPSMAFLFLLAIVIAARPRTKSEWKRLVSPAAGVALFLCVSLGTLYGPRVLLNTLLPLAGRDVYRQNGFGFFFGSGRLFWLSQRPRFAFDFETPAGVWIAANLILIASAVRQIAKGQNNPDSAVGRNILTICAALHLAFVVLFFGNRWSWVYYFDFLVIGVALVSATSRAGRVAVVLLTLMALPIAAKSLRGASEGWSHRKRSEATFGLWASKTVADEWLEARRLTRGRHPVLLATSDGAAMFDPGFSRPEVSFLVRGHLRPEEFRRKRLQVRVSEAVIVANPAPDDPWFDEWPEFRDDLSGHALVWSCPRLRVYLRAGAESKISSKKSM